jgi:hypothetical protein
LLGWGGKAARESDVGISAVGAFSIPRESVKPGKTNLRLCVAPNKFAPIDLTINFPKKTKNELRVYRVRLVVLLARKGTFGLFLQAKGNFTLGACLKLNGGKSDASMRMILSTPATFTSRISFRPSWRRS